MYRSAVLRDLEKAGIDMAGARSKIANYLQSGGGGALPNGRRGKETKKKKEGKVKEGEGVGGRKDSSPTSISPSVSRKTRLQKMLSTLA